MYIKTLFLSLSLSLFPILLLGQENPLLGHPLLPSDTGKVYKVVEESPMPLFPDCEDAYSYKEMRNCAVTKLGEFIYAIQQYPEDALSDGIEGMARVSFILERDGRITNIKSIRPVCPSIKAESLYMVDMMALDLGPWRPGKQEGKPVRFQYNLLIKFKLPRD